MFIVTILWYDSKITVGVRSVFSKSFNNLDILFVNDCIDEKGNVHAFDYVKNV